nr:MAG TPA: hypothetical protein [Caudoviricetes sp.]
MSACDYRYEKIRKAKKTLCDPIFGRAAFFAEKVLQKASFGAIITVTKRKGRCGT